MAIELCAVGGYNEVGKNMTAVKVDGSVFVIDMGLHLESYIKATEEEEDDIIQIGTEELIDAGAVPNIDAISDWKPDVKAIMATHAHLDHVGALPFMANNFGAPIFATPFTKEVIRSLFKDEKISQKIKTRAITLNSERNIGLKAEFISVTHSTPQTAVIVLHTKQGAIVYANDFKLDKTPILETKPNMKRLEEIGKKGVLALILDSTYAPLDAKTPSESSAREMLRDVMLNRKAEGMIVTTFSSHLARLKSIVEFGKQLNRKVVFLGRSLSKYSRAGEDVGIADFLKDVDRIKYNGQIKKFLRKIAKEKKKYLIVATGHQGEPKSTLSRMANNEFDFRLDSNDVLIFSCKTIPTETNIANRRQLEMNLGNYGLQMFRDVHVSGHAAGKDLAEMINLLKPKHVIPAHGELKMTSALAGIARNNGFKNVHELRNGERIRLD